MAGRSVWGLHHVHVTPHAVKANGSIACVVPLHMLGTSDVAVGGSPAGSLITPCVRGLLGVGGLVECCSTSIVCLH